MNTDFEFAIVGGGGMGSTTAYYLAREKKSVVVIEQFDIGHNRGASHGENRIIRYSYEHLDYVRLAKETYELWYEAEKELNRTLVSVIGGLDLGYPGNTDFDDCIECMTREGVPFEVLDHIELKRRFPQFKVDPTTRGLYQKDGGYVEPDVSVPAFLKLAESYGAAIKPNTIIQSINILDDCVEITSQDESWRVRKLILTAGPWAGPLLKGIGFELPIKVTLEQYAFFTPQNRQDFQDDRFPVFFTYLPPGEIDLYGFPNYNELGVKVGEHRAGELTTAATRSMSPDSDKLARLQKRVQKLFPDLSGPITKSATCLYSNTPDTHFLVDLLPGHRNVIVAAGFSGHGFKFIPVIGKILVDLATTGETTRPIGMFSFCRFASSIA